MTLALVALFLGGCAVGAFVTVLVLIAVDARRYGYRPVPAVDGARRGIRAGLFRSIHRPDRRQLTRE